MDSARGVVAIVVWCRNSSCNSSCDVSRCGERLSHSFCCFKHNRLFVIVRLKGMLQACFKCGRRGKYQINPADHASFAKASAPYKGQNRQIGVKKLPFPSVPEMGALSQKIPIGLHKENDDFVTQRGPFLGHISSQGYFCQAIVDLPNKQKIGVKKKGSRK